MMRHIRRSLYRFVRLVPFGVGISSAGMKEGHPVIRICTELENLEKTVTEVTLYSGIYSPQGEMLEELTEKLCLHEMEKRIVVQFGKEIKNPSLRSLDEPWLYMVESIAETGGETSDRELFRAVRV